jgi:hypothetical protein
VGAGLVRRYRLEINARGIQKWPTRGSENESINTITFPIGQDWALQALKNSIVFAIDRDQLCTSLPNRLNQQGSRHNDRFFVGQENTLTSPGGGHGRQQTCGTHDSCHYAIDTGQACGFLQPLRTIPDTRSQSRLPQTFGQRLSASRIGNDRQLRLKLPALLEQQSMIRMCSKRLDPDPQWIAPSHVQSAYTNTPGRPEYRQPFSP